ncbi:MAG: NUDIX domain-containing protein [Bacteroidales bacterium]|nr:NUDIX domain-containing protein [Bacteroidales bacterium]
MGTIGTAVTKILAPGSLDDSELTYVVMGARYRGQWIFVRHRERQSWELPAGHIEAGEGPDQAAVRELYEEAGVVNSTLSIISDYGVKVEEHQAFGRLYFADVKELEPLPDHEIEEIKFGKELPSNLTYPEVQTLLFSLLTLH